MDSGWRDAVVGTACGQEAEFICKNIAAWVALPFDSIRQGSWMKRFLVGIDGSDCGDRAISTAVVQARAAGADLVICYVIAWSPYTFSTPQENAERHRRREEELESARSKLLEPWVDKLK